MESLRELSTLSESKTSFLVQLLENDSPNRVCKGVSITKAQHIRQVKNEDDDIRV